MDSCLKARRSQVWTQSFSMELVCSPHVYMGFFLGAWGFSVNWTLEQCPLMDWQRLEVAQRRPNGKIRMFDFFGFPSSLARQPIQQTSMWTNRMTQDDAWTWRRKRERDEKWQQFIELCNSPLQDSRICPWESAATTDSFLAGWWSLMTSDWERSYL